MRLASRLVTAFVGAARGLSRSPPRMASSLGGASAPTIKLNDGTSHPQIGFGTYKVGFIPASASAAVAGAEESGGEVQTATSIVMDALDVGYRFLDCAQFYGNEVQVGEALRAAAIPRADLYLASKCWSDAIYAGPAAVRAQVERSLRELGTDYLDLYLVHWPVPGKHVEAYLELERCQKDGLVRSIGVSNYAVEDIEELLEQASVVPAVNQIECNPFLYRRETLAYLKSKNIAVQAYRALRDGKAFEDPTITAVAKKHGATAAQVLGAWCVAKGAIYMPKSTKRERMVENADVVALASALDADDVSRLDALTTPDAIAAYKLLYEKCVVRDTPLAEDDAGIKRDITAG